MSTPGESNVPLVRDSAIDNMEVEETDLTPQPRKRARSESPRGQHTRSTRARIERWQTVEDKRKSKPRGVKAQKSSSSTTEQEKQMQGQPKPTNGQNKEKHRKDRRRKKKNDAVKISAAAGVSYADIIRKLNGNADLKTGNQVVAIRRTKKKELLILTKNGKDTADFVELAKKTLSGTDAQVTPLIATKTLEIRDIDETAEKEDVEAATKESLGNDAPANVSCVLFDGYGGMKIALITIPEQAADVLLEKGKIRINLVNCRVKERIEIRRCQRCLGFGHGSSRCGGKDRSECCWNCGESGHQGKSCSNKSKCLACEDEKVNPDHKSGSKNCPTFRKELDRRKAKQKSSSSSR